ncbi:glutathione S-transferase N-terminal domain-containing protein [Methylocapsa sp. S129]|uniref:glutathione S-transferase N-terminal domain-containing protein n=1 Tax=Methylocapsa sp. S129 TaxID=1641869 RepID=UPI00131BD18B|nr:glutathione S-transferase N-terminal domain-containing protein [Methylocapsa sp. S129]
MDLYFSPLSCSMATRISLYESGDAANFLEVDPKTKTLVGDGSDYLAIYPLGMVPSLRTDDGQLLTENAAILQYVADRRPESGLAPTEAIERTRLHQWLCFIGTELHKGLFVPLLGKKTPAEMKAYVLANNLSRLAYLDTYLTGREFLLDRFTIADAYLATVLNWTQVIPSIDMGLYPAVADYLDRHRKRASVAKAMAEEVVLWQAERARHKAA